MTASEFCRIRETRYPKALAMALDLGISETSVWVYSRGEQPVPHWIAQRLLLRLQHGLPCVRCGNATVAEFWDGCCGCCTQLLPETDES